MQLNQRLNLLSLLQSFGLQRCSLHFPLQCCRNHSPLSAYAGELTADDKNRINAISRKAMRLGLTLRLTMTRLLTSQIAISFGRPLRQVTVCTIFFLLKPPPTVLIIFVRGNISTCFPLFNIYSLKLLYQSLFI